jgi:hypothetical protein
MPPTEAIGSPIWTFLPHKLPKLLRVFWIWIRMASLMDFSILLAKAPDDELEAITRDYVRLASHGLESHLRPTFEQRRDACISECLGRGKADIRDRATGNRDGILSR